MNTPVCDFVNEYIQKNSVRFHMPGHKGKSFMKNNDNQLSEAFDITEIDGADELYAARGIIEQSQANASHLFGCPTFYSTEGSSHVIRAMLWLLKNKMGEDDYILSCRNVHKTFSLAVAVLDIKVKWIMPAVKESYQSCVLTAKELEAFFKKSDRLPFALYITSPDYLGHLADIKGLSDVCKKYGVFLVVDNAHGAYLKFLNSSCHPVDLGADMCCDSGHKTLPVLTGGAYLHISENTEAYYRENASTALSVFGSTSPSYLILQSLDKANIYMSDMKTELSDTITEIERLKQAIESEGYKNISEEPLKITINLPGDFAGNFAGNLAAYLYENGIIPEYYDKDYIVLMFSTNNSKSEIKLLETALLNWIKEFKAPLNMINDKTGSGSICRNREDDNSLEGLRIKPPVQAMTANAAMFAEKELISLSECEGRVLALSTTGCPPAVPLFMGGEIIELKRFAECGLYDENVKLLVVK